MDSPPRKKQKGQQLTLFGGVLVGSAIHKERNLYEKFVNSFVARYSYQSVAREDVVASAQAKWREMRDDRAAAEKYVADVGDWKRRNTRSTDGSCDVLRERATSNVTTAVVLTNSIPCCPIY